MGIINWGSPLGTSFPRRNTRRLKHFNKNKAEAEEAMGSRTEQFSFITERQVSEPSLSQCCELTYFTITHAARALISDEGASAHDPACMV